MSPQPRAGRFWPLRPVPITWDVTCTAHRLCTLGEPLKPNKNMTVAEVGSLFDAVIPLKDDQKVIFKLLSDSILYCQAIGSSAWSLTMLPTGFRLNVGQVEVMTWGVSYLEADEEEGEEAESFSVVRLLLCGEDCQTKLVDEEECFEEMSYASVGDKHWCYTSDFQHSRTAVAHESRLPFEKDLAALRSNHHRFLQKASRTSTGKLRQKSHFAQHHCPALYEYAIRLVDGR